MLAWLPLLVAMFQFAREVVRLRAEHAEATGVGRLAPVDRKAIDGAVVQAVRSMTPADLVKAPAATPPTQSPGVTP